MGKKNDSDWPSWLDQLEAVLDKRICVTLRDDRVLEGCLRSYDQYGNLLLEGTIEKVYGPAKYHATYSEIYIGKIIIRGENSVILGQLKLPSEMEDTQFTKVKLKTLYELYEKEGLAATFYQNIGRPKKLQNYEDDY